MTIHRKNPKRDANEQEIIDALRKAGCSVQQLSGVGVPDLLVGVSGSHLCYGKTDNDQSYFIDDLNILMEVKAPKAKLTEDQETWHNEWRGQVCIVRSVEDALRAIGRM